MDDEKEKMIDMPDVQEQQDKKEGGDEDKAATSTSGLLAGWTSQDRKKSKEYLVNATSVNAGSTATPFEEKVFKAVGETLARILRYVLKRWHKAMRIRLEKHTLRAIKAEAQVELIMTYLKLYEKEYELAFGLMEEQNHAQTDPVSTVHIRSTGYAAEVFLGIIMADRVWAINQKRKALCETHNFMTVDVNTLTEENQYCNICCDELGVANPEGELEKPIRVVICCHQVFGENCLKLWLKENWKTFDRDTCPNCRFKFPESFLKKLLGKEWKRRKDGCEDDDESDEDEDDDGSQSNVDEDERGSGDSSEDIGTSSEDTHIAEARPATPQTTEQFVNIVVVEGGLPFAEPFSAEVDTPMSNTQDEEHTQIEVTEVVEDVLPTTTLVTAEILPSVEREDDFMTEG